MNKYTLISETSDPRLPGLTSKITHEFEAELLPDVIMYLDAFLRGCGFVFRGQLEIIEDAYDEETLKKEYGEYDDLTETYD